MNLTNNLRIFSCLPKPPKPVVHLIGIWTYPRPKRWSSMFQNDSNLSQKTRIAQIHQFGVESLQGIDFPLVIHKSRWHIYVLFVCHLKEEQA
jgi:hypothetical protein